MPKKIFSLSILTLSILSVPVFASSMEDRLDQQIGAFIEQKNNPQQTETSSNDNSWWGTAKQAGGAVGSVIRSSARTVGDLIRPAEDENELTNLATRELGMQVINMVGEDGSSGKILKCVVGDKKLTKTVQRGLGNAARAFGEIFGEETPTVERVICKWIEKEEIGHIPNTYLPIITTVLFQKFNNIDERGNYFNQTIKKINRSSKLIHIDEKVNPVDCFVKGYIRYLVKNSEKTEIAPYIPLFTQEDKVDLISEQSKKNLLRFYETLDYFSIIPVDDFSVVKKITVQDAYSDKKSQNEIEKEFTVTQIKEKVTAYKEGEALKFIAKLFEKTYNKYKMETVTTKVNNQNNISQNVSRNYLLDNSDSSDEVEILTDRSDRSYASDTSSFRALNLALSTIQHSHAAITQDEDTKKTSVSE